MNINELKNSLKIPVIGAPLFIVSNPKLVIEQCKSGIVGSFPALNARPQNVLDEWIVRIKDELAEAEQGAPTRIAGPAFLCISLTVSTWHFLSLIA